MNADPEVREHFPQVLTREESAASIAHFQAELDRRGWGWWAVEVAETGEFIGVTGLDPVDDGLPFEGVEIRTCPTVRCAAMCCTGFGQNAPTPRGDPRPVGPSYPLTPVQMSNGRAAQLL